MIGKGVLMILGILVFVLFFVALYDAFFETKSVVRSNYPLIGRFRAFFHSLRPFFRQYFGDDDAFVPRIVIDWIRHVSLGKQAYFSFDKFDTTGMLHDGNHQMIHSDTPLNNNELSPIYPLIGEKRKYPLQFYAYTYRSAISLGSLSFEATSAMAKACADMKVCFNTGEGGFSVHHIPNVPFSYEKKYFTYKKIPKRTKIIYHILPGKRLKNRFLERCGNFFQEEKGPRDRFLFDKKHWLFYTIDWDAPLSVFPRPDDLNDDFGYLIFQIGSGLYGVRRKVDEGNIEIDRERFQKITSFCRAVEIKLAQGSKQIGGILKASKNTEVIAEIRGVQPYVDIQSPNRFPYFQPGDYQGFFSFLEKVSKKSGGKPVGCKIVVSDERNIEGFAKEMSRLSSHCGPDFFTIDGGDGGSATAPLSLGILFGKQIYDAIEIVDSILKKYGVRDRIKIFASSKLYAPYMSARALALGADAIGNARGMMIAGGCIRAGLCSGEFGDCPIGMATMKKNKRRGYEQVWEEKVQQIKNYISAHEKGLLQVAAVAGVSSPHLLNKKHIHN